MIFACVVGLDGADQGSVGAMAAPLQHAFRIGDVEFGLLLTVSLLSAAGATFIFGWLADRTNRIRLLVWTVVAWPIAP